jgi:hypothetical protein
MFQEVSRQHLMTVNSVQSQASPHEICQSLLEVASNIIFNS